MLTRGGPVCNVESTELRIHTPLANHLANTIECVLAAHVFLAQEYTWQAWRSPNSMVE